ncbi:hypothetical protein MJA45_26755 [Paenibacillus aurantius]|uniref:Uncharacterized protein n=1 Tax=Paenibacillus aurantius TaxID=2918900 RepID=A0AA96RFE5_9BACL|nr:hypothetical protein [Paenibacillus aurantius]WNQ11158.1 hypothetical protein MJA45_26755 [Paenibacillus aurantius]
MLDWIRRINLIWVFVLLFGFHGLLYYYLGTANWLTVTLLATAVDTAVVAALQYLLLSASRRKEKGE